MEKKKKKKERVSTAVHARACAFDAVFPPHPQSFSDGIHDLLCRFKACVEFPEFVGGHRDPDTIGKLEVNLGRKHLASKDRRSNDLVNAPLKRLNRWAHSVFPATAKVNKDI